MSFGDPAHGNNNIATINRKVAQKLLDDAKANPKSPYAGKFVGIANARVVAVADDWAELARSLPQSEPGPEQGVQRGSWARLFSSP